MSLSIKKCKLTTQYRKKLIAELTNIGADMHRPHEMKLKVLEALALNMGLDPSQWHPLPDRNKQNRGRPVTRVIHYEYNTR
ncbi:hypothetical protein [Paenibacillus curdlanolyticus]|uniref:hypothetical protein n=1 Tax=Paenibacillus curdlanolyticus TaxID=59840 RepID=UPI001185F4B5|nr:hypothetical protein [Paenibacillus curdlanolyticus]